MKTWMALVLAVACGCQSPEPPPPAPVTDRLEFKMLTKERTYGDCIAGSEGCTYVRLDYPVLVDAPEGYAVRAVTDAVFATVTAAHADAVRYDDVETLQQAFIESYEALKRDQPDYPHAWFLERKTFVIHNTPDVLSLSVSERTYTGGAHGLATLTFRNLSPRTGEPLGLADVLLPGFESKLLPLAEAKFREARDIEEGVSLADAGFTFFEGGVFTLTDNFAIGDDGLSFYYNVYEVAPYAFGPTEIVLGYDELSGLMKE